jgi:ADP-ribosylglycohydrolase
MLLGLAVGDALGIPTEGRLGFERRLRYHRCEIRDYLGGVGCPSDDTQLAFWTLEQLLADDGLAPANLARLFLARRLEVRGMGKVVREFCARGLRGGSWETWAAPPSARGNGALMRIAPILIPHLKHPTADLWADTVLAARITHNGSASTAGCVGLIALLWQCLGMNTPPEPRWWIDEFVRHVGPLECCENEAEVGLWKGQSFTLAGFVERHLWDAFEKGWSVRQACSPQGNAADNPWGETGWSSGSFVMETLPSVLFILMKHAHSFEEGVLQAVNFTRDNDTIAAIVGAILGALHGKDAIPKCWLEGLSGRTRRPHPPSDDGQVFRLTAQALQRWA